MDISAVLFMILGMAFTWGLPILVIIAIIILFKKVNRLEKKVDGK